VPDTNDRPNRGERRLYRRRTRAELWPKIKTPLQLTLAQLVGWALRKWLG
jgi:hypothetical protein